MNGALVHRAGAARIYARGHRGCLVDEARTFPAQGVCQVGTGCALCEQGAHHSSEQMTQHYAVRPVRAGGSLATRLVRPRRERAPCASRELIGPAVAPCANSRGLTHRPSAQTSQRRCLAAAPTPRVNHERVKVLIKKSRAKQARSDARGELGCRLVEARTHNTLRQPVTGVRPLCWGCFDSVRLDCASRSASGGCGSPVRWGRFR